MLNLRQIDKTDTQTIDPLSSFSAPQFRVAESIFGNFGEPLEHGASLLGEDAEEQDQEDVVDQTLPTDVASKAGDSSNLLLEYGALRESERDSKGSIEGITKSRMVGGSVV